MIDAFLAYSNDLIMLFDVSGTVVWASPSSQHLFGVPPSALVGLNGFEMIHADDQGRAFEAFSKLTSVGDQVRVELRVTDPTGRTRWVEEAVTNLVDEPEVGGIVAHLRDITDRREAEAAVRFQAAVVNAVGQAITARDMNSVATYWNAAATELFGWTAEEAIGRPMGDFIRVAPGYEERLKEAHAAHLAARPWSEEMAVVRKDGEVIHVQTTATPVFDDDGRLLGTITASNDLTERHKAEQALIHQATHDPLTGLPNRRLFMDELDAVLSKAPGPTDDRVVVIFVDLDDFKAVNDRLGHAGADEVLRQLGGRIAAVVPPGGMVGRLGGDEFVIWVSGQQLDPHDLGREVQVAIQRPVSVDDVAVVLDASIGIAVAGSERRARAVLHHADLAMFAAKQAGGGRAEIFDDALDELQRRRNELVTELRAALDAGDLVTYFQPELHLATGAIFGFEALARWNHPERGVVGPDEFIPVAEESGLIAELGHQMLTNACRALARWNEIRPEPPLSVGVNVSPFQMAEPSFPDVVRRAIEEHRIRPGQLVLEVTESSLMDDEAAPTTIRRLQALGVVIAMDDFGTGYSSFRRLKEMPISFLKIDRSFVADIGRSPADDVIVATMTAMAHTLGVQVIAEGIETEDQRSFLHERGCAFGQGYLWSRPLTEADATALLSGPSLGRLQGP